MRRTILLATAFMSVGLSVAVAQNSAPAKTGQTAAGPVLTNASGMTLYTFTRDMPGFSNCNDACAVASPPFVADANAKAGGDWSVITRDDGKKQWAYKGKAVYSWSKDAAPGDATAEGAANGKWHVAKP
jgi:predicted lipoprotein with Yx(FWY)xxD motif